MICADRDTIYYLIWMPLFNKVTNQIVTGLGLLFFVVKFEVLSEEFQRSVT
jgi:hypothetical protein